MSVVRQMQREAAGDGGPVEPPPSRRTWPRSLRSKGGRLGVLLFAVGLGLGFGAFPVVFQWSGKNPRALTVEQAVAVARDPQTAPNRVGTLVAWLTAFCRRGIVAISQLKADADLGSQASLAVSRLRSVVDGAVPDRSSRRYPTWVGFQRALETLESNSAKGEPALDCLEVVVCNIEEAVSVFQATSRSPGLPGQQARAAIEILKDLLR